MSEEREVISRIAVIATLGLLLVSFLAVKTVYAQAGQVTLKPTDDTYVDFNNPDSNYGEQPYLQIQFLKDYPLPGFFWPRSIVWIKFNLSSVPEGAVVGVASLRLYTCSVNFTYNVSAYIGDNSWNESTLTWDNAPTWNNTMDSISVTTNNQWYNWSILDAVRDALENNSTSMTVVLSSPSAVSSQSGIWFDSREAITDLNDLSPQLTIHWSEVVFEFPSLIILAFFMTAVLIAMVFYKRKATGLAFVRAL